ncbi:MAG: hypothetical protein FJ122_12025 [Deltaproteobacteria bacterium]|nr:hypothetical protein [Deltaproteobacteria bacterium]
MTYLVFYVFFSIIIGLLGTNRKFGFWGYFFYSLLFTPFLGVIILLASDKKVPPKCESADGR